MVTAQAMPSLVPPQASGSSNASIKADSPQRSLFCLFFFRKKIFNKVQMVHFLNNLTIFCLFFECFFSKKLTFQILKNKGLLLWMWRTRGKINSLQTSLQVTTVILMAESFLTSYYYRFFTLFLITTYFCLTSVLYPYFTYTVFYSEKNHACKL